MLLNWPPPGTKIRTLHTLTAGHITIPANSSGILTRTISKRENLEKKEHRFEIAIQDRTIIVNREDIEQE